MSYSREEIISALKEFKKTFDNYTISNYQLFSEGEDFPSFSQIRYQLGNWIDIQKEYLFVPEICKKCDIGRCRFDYNLNECEYYEGE